MRVFVAGATGAIGRPLVPRLIAAGHEVTAMTRSAAKTAALREAGAEPVVCDALDAEALRAAVVAARPDAVVHQLTDIPAEFSPRRFAAAFEGTDRLRSDGTRNLVAAAQAAGAERIVAQSIAFAYRPGPGLRTEDDPLLGADAPADFTRTAAAIATLEETVLEAGGTVLRYGQFYGPGTGYAASDGAIAERVRKRGFPVVGGGGGVMSFVHVDDAADATVAAVEQGKAGVFNVVDDEPAPAREWLPVYADALGAKPPRRVPAWLARLLAGRYMTEAATSMAGASNARARDELGWRPAHASWRQGFRDAAG
ncbi:MAG: hypothetical protein QOJ07_342 [Thermoleophilaceae bacterium]|nr:hypothetical protein [Thermoleophilaceae bacterium]